jgi:predicted RNA binding protein YcfA (HicA-like mRNA interferase family)
MSKLVIKPSKLLTILVKYYNFKPIRQKGSHVFLTNFEHSKTIPMHGGDLDQGTLGAVLKQAGLTKEDIIKYL